MKKYVRVMDGIKCNAGSYEYKLNEINVSNYWNPNETEPEKMDEFIKEFEDYAKKSESFNYDELVEDDKIIDKTIKEI